MKKVFLKEQSFKYALEVGDPNQVGTAALRLGAPPALSGGKLALYISIALLFFLSASVRVSKIV